MAFRDFELVLNGEYEQEALAIAHILQKEQQPSKVVKAALREALCKQEKFGFAKVSLNRKFREDSQSTKLRVRFRVHAAKEPELFDFLSSFASTANVLKLLVCAYLTNEETQTKEISEVADEEKNIASLSEKRKVVAIKRSTSWGI